MFGPGGLVAAAGCVGDTQSRGRPAGPDADSLTLAAATTAHDSGLLADIVPGFERTFGVRVEALARGTGSALRTARDGDCDVVLVHARPLEDEFLRRGHGVNRRTVAVNDFLVVGPPGDPAGAAGEDPVAAFRAVADAEAPFLSRGDRSGTHVRERRLWSEAGVDPSGPWYRESGQGMGDTLVAAGRMGTYTLSDRGTFLTVGTGERLAAHVAGGVEDPPPLLRNEYAAIPTNPAGRDVAYPLAMAFVGYLTGPGQRRIADFRVDDRRAFRPVGPDRSPEFRQYVPGDWSGGPPEPTSGS